MSLTIRFRDVYDTPLEDRADLNIWDDVTGSTVLQIKDISTTRTLKVDALSGRRYKIRVFPQHYRAVARAILMPLSGKREISMVCPIHPDRVRDAQFPEFPQLDKRLQDVLNDSRVEGFDNRSGRSLYERIGDIPRAGLLNLFAKMAETQMPDGRFVFDYLKSIFRIRGDRIFANVDVSLRDQVKSSVATGLFDPADDSQHTPPDGYHRAGSFKTDDRFGNLQLTFFAGPGNPPDFKVDADIDAAKGISHIFQVLRNWLTSGATHPFDIHQILLRWQGLDPGYRLEV